jgi:N-acetylmuramoyl-L-alanine amidase
MFENCGGYMRFVKLLFFIIFASCIVFSLSASSVVTLKFNNSSICINPILSNPSVLLPLHEIADFYGIDFLWNVQNEQMILSKDGQSVRLTLKNQYALINGTKLVSLSIPPTILQGAFSLSPKDTVSILSEIFSSKNVSYDEQTTTIVMTNGKDDTNTENTITKSEPVENPAFYKSSDLPGNFDLKTIVIDSGHGGHDSGASRSGVHEKNIVLDVANKLADILKSRTKFKVVLTRSTDVFIPLPQRTSIANRYPADSTLFICIHCNASRSKTGGRGTETYIFNLEATDAEARALASRENEGEAMDLTMMLSHLYHTGTEPYTLDIAGRVQRSLTTKLELDNRGVRKAPFWVLAGTKMPGILVELAYVSNTEEREKLQSDSFRQKAAEALYDAIKGFHNAVNRSLAKAKPN